jgi:hypothetical protein
MKKHGDTEFDQLFDQFETKFHQMQTEFDQLHGEEKIEY